VKSGVKTEAKKALDYFQYKGFSYFATLLLNEAPFY
jgi:hypothetical protein